eukprot:5302591-Lingulodinium_polyedra.AAC.1
MAPAKRRHGTGMATAWHRPPPPWRSGWPPRAGVSPRRAAGMPYGWPNWPGKRKLERRTPDAPARKYRTAMAATRRQAGRLEPG